METKPCQIIGFGDSITLGQYDAEGGWVDRLKRDAFAYTLAQGSEKGISVINLGIAGETTEEALVRFERELSIRADKDMKRIVLFAYGANDSAWLDKQEMHAVTKESFRNNLAKLAEIGLKHADTVGYLTITPIIEKVTAVANHEGKVRTSAWYAEYDKAIEEVAHHYQGLFVDTRVPFVGKEIETLVSPDGLHPTTLGHELVYQVVKQALVAYGLFK